ncbi:MAG: hypothetical protein F6K19_07315 [Cyanothece sp. SIO1E1]|nr:hypothetical protein [Cyanothece sp. SIO1E1]
MTHPMKWANALSTQPSLEAALAEVIDRAQQQLQSTADMGLIFISSAFASEYSRLMPLLKERLSVPVLIGCGGVGVAGMNPQGLPEEVEENPALSLTLAHLPDVKLHAFHISTDELPDLDSSPDAWVKLVGVSPQEQPQFILLAAPFASGLNDFLQGLDFAYPGAVKVGGLATTESISGSSGLFCNYQRYQDGIVGIALSGNVVLEAIVAQGCRPIGCPYRVTQGEKNILLGLEVQANLGETACDADASQTQTPLEALQDLFQTLDESDRKLAQHSLFIGVAQSEFKQNLEHGDFLIRNLIGIDPKLGAIAIGDRIRPGQRIQFHLRDAQASAKDLEMLLERYRKQAEANSTAAAGALIFTCMGRGEELYNQPNFDSELFCRYVEHIPLGGFFCGGEIGPIENTTFLHGFTSVFGICRQP